MTPSERQPLLISGLPGRMAVEVARLARGTDDLAVQRVGLSSSVRHGSRCAVDAMEIKLVAPGRESIRLPRGTIAVDYSTPGAALDNARWFIAHGLPFVMGTTGFDPAELEPLMRKASAPAVVAPNMAPPIVLLQAALRWLADEFPGACRGATLSVRESHQQGKRDTSGTARALVGYFQQLGIDFDESRIEALRDPQRQRKELAVPEAFLGAHAFHRYELDAAHDTVGLVLEHNVLGRRVYAEGTLRAVRFLRARIEAGVAGVIFGMEDVLREPDVPIGT